jgi:hypothetical protein
LDTPLPPLITAAIDTAKLCFSAGRVRMKIFISRCPAWRFGRKISDVAGRKQKFLKMYGKKGET